MTTYSDRTSAVALQDRFINEARVNVVGRVTNVLEKATGLPVRMAQEGERKHFTNSDYRIYRSKHLRLGIVVRVPMYSKPESRD